MTSNYSKNYIIRSDLKNTLAASFQADHICRTHAKIRATPGLKLHHAVTRWEKIEQTDSVEILKASYNTRYMRSAKRLKEAVSEADSTICARMNRGVALRRASTGLRK